MIKNVTIFVCAGILGGVVTLIGNQFINQQERQESSSGVSAFIKNTSHKSSAFDVAKSEKIDFTTIAEKSVHAVVHVKNMTTSGRGGSFFDYFYGNGYNRQNRPRLRGTGSGVIISGDGYIVTNNHVIKQADEIEVTLNNKKSYPAKVIGKDSENDIALLKIESEKELPYLSFGNSENIKIGEWVLAVGNPYNLTSTVTAGIISAKGRDLSTMDNKIESFIQTDAAVNEGNSGGALVNIRGELIGINTAISSATGGFVGYSFAVPSNIARKIIEDLMIYGSVKKAMLGIRYSIQDDNEGVKINEVIENSAAKKGGLKEGDIIVKIDNKKINNFADLNGKLTEKRPEETISITVIRGGKKITKKIKLSARKTIIIAALGLELEDVSEQEKKKRGIGGGAKIKNIGKGGLQYANIEKGAIILSINGVKVNNKIEAKEVLENAQQRVKITILSPNNEKMTYVIGL